VRRRDFLASLAGLAGATALAGCGDDRRSKDSERPLERDEAARLANALFANYDIGGATFTYAGQVAGGTLMMEGDVSYVGHVGHAVVSNDGPERSITEVYWSDAEVVERLSGLPEALQSVGELPLEWVLRAPAIDTRELDSAIAVLLGLASEQRDNPELIRQTEGAAFLRRQQLRGREVEVLRYGTTTNYWIDVETALMMRFEGNNATGTAARLVDLRDHGARDVTPPSPQEVVLAAELGQLYDQLRAAG
jgi:hypothetical protein